jgi:hypothetical protein
LLERFVVGRPSLLPPREARRRQRLQSVEETHKSSSLCVFVSLVALV